MDGWMDRSMVWVFVSILWLIMWKKLPCILDACIRYAYNVCACTIQKVWLKMFINKPFSLSRSKWERENRKNVKYTHQFTMISNHTNYRIMTERFIEFNVWTFNNKLLETRVYQCKRSIRFSLSLPVSVCVCVMWHELSNIKRNRVVSRDEVINFVEYRVWCAREYKNCIFNTNLNDIKRKKKKTRHSESEHEMLEHIKWNVLI